MWLNEYEIDEVKEIVEARAPEIAPYARFMADWRDTVNANSDGWAYWKAGSKCAEKLGDLLGRARDAIRGRGTVPDEKLFKAALAPIRAAATKHGLTAPELSVPIPGVETLSTYGDVHAHWDKYDPANERRCWDEITAMAADGQPPTLEHPTVLRLMELAHASGYSEADSFLSDHGAEASDGESDEAKAARAAFVRYEEGDYFAAVAKSEEAAAAAVRRGKGGDLAAASMPTVAAGMRESFEEGRAERFEASAAPTI